MPLRGNTKDSPVTWVARPLSPCRPQRTAGAFVGGFRCDTAAADAAPQQLDSVVVSAHRLLRRCAFRYARCVAQPALHAAHAAACRDYGAGEAGAQLAAALRLAGNHRIVTFLDDNPSYWDRAINGAAIQPPQKLIEMEESIDQVLLAIPSLSRSERRRIVEQLQRRGIPTAGAFGG